MNIENVQEVINRIKASPHEFDMYTTLVHTCGTPACIAGFTHELGVELGKVEAMQHFVLSQCYGVLGISLMQARELCYPDDDPCDPCEVVLNKLWRRFYYSQGVEMPPPEEIPADDAVKMLEMLISGEMHFTHGH